jgi:hypothetical protein
MAFFDDHIDGTKHELRNWVIQVLAADPSTPVDGQVYYNSTTKRIRTYNGTAWVEYGTGAGAGDVSQASASGSAGRMKVSAGADKTITDYAGGAGLVKSDANGVVSLAAAGTDYLTGSSTNALTNKTFDANGTGNTLTNVEVADLAASAVNSSTTLAGATNSQLPTALAVKTYADNLIASNDAMVYKGGIDASANPNYPAADAGHTYKITVAGLIGGAGGVAVQAGDTLICTVDASASGNHATVGANWTIVQSNVDQATTSTLGLTRYATPAEAEAGSLTNVALTPASIANYTQTKAFTFGDGAALTYTLTHNLNTLDVIVQVRDVAGNEVRYPKIVNATVNTVQISGYITAPALNSMRAVIQG